MKKLLLTVMLSILIAGCATVDELNPGAENVIVMFPPVPASCKQLGYISSADVNGVSQAYTTHAELVKKEVYDLANKTVDMGGNVLVILTHKTEYSGKTQDSVVDRHKMGGIACYCQYERLPRLYGHPVSGLKFDQMVFE